MSRLVILSVLFCVSLFSFSEDIELYIGDASQRAGTKPQVLIILDNSGSMNTDQSVKSPYDPSVTYAAVGGNNALSDKYIYFTKGSEVDGVIPVPDSNSETRRFLDSINSCATAREKLNTVGFYTGQVREYTFKGNSGSWQEIPDNNGSNIETLDCEDDVREDLKAIEAEQTVSKNINAGIAKKNGTITPLPNGYPIDGEGNKGNPVYYTEDINASNVVWTGEVVTLYTDNYLRWANNDDIATVDISRLEIAKDTIIDLIDSIPSIEFGLQIFNYDFPYENNRDGGRVIFGIQDLTDDARTNLVNLIDLSVDGETNTPLCETLYEASRYFGGNSVLYGNDDSSYGGYVGNTPPRDVSISPNNIYTSPYSGCSNEIFVIIITDGVPTLDHGADDEIQLLDGVGGAFTISDTETSYLPALAGWMHNNDLNTTLADDQIATTFTIGFSSGATAAQPLLEETARLGGGEYYDATDPSALGASLQEALSTILAVNTSFTAPSVASNNFDRTETLNAVYYAMFVPDHGPRWYGNLKKLKVVDGVQVDRNGDPAINDDGSISATAKTFWSTSTTADGNEVREGGVAEMLHKKTSRTVYSNLLSDVDDGDGGTNRISSLIALTKTNAIGHYGTEALLASELDVTTDDIDDYLSWATGIDVDDSDEDNLTTDMRPDVFGDPLHSKPLVINYGGSEDSQDVRILVGTNSGAIHMFDDNDTTVDENWAFMPNEFFDDIKTLRHNYASSDKVYAIDGSAVSYLHDANGDGSISGTGEKAWAFFGLRRGGSSYYALDVTSPDSPKLLWKIDSDTDGFSQLGQSWSEPRVGFSKLNIVDGDPKPVLIFSAGYSGANKDAIGVGKNDTIGLGIFMLDAESGTLLWSLTPDDETAINQNFGGFTDSIASGVAILDSDSDGLIDRLYTGDTGGNVWRVDMPGADPFSTSTPWTIFKLAELGGNSEDSSDDRRFFSEPSIVRTYITDTISTSTTVSDVTTVTITKQERPYEAILIGSGDRSTPSATDTNDKFFMIKDENIATSSFKATGTEYFKEIPAAITVDDLYDYTDNPFGEFVEPLTADQKSRLQTLEIDVGLESGWYVDYETPGEKNTAAAIAINNVAYFTSFTPAQEDESVDSCVLQDGYGQLYAIDLALGTTIHDWRTWEIAAGIPDTPSIIITDDPEEDSSETPSEDDPPGEKRASIKLLAGKIIPLDINLTTSRTYLYVTEEN